MRVLRAVGLIIWAIRSVVVVYLTISKKTANSTTTQSKSFGLRVQLWSLEPIYGIVSAVLTKIFGHTWRKLTCVGVSKGRGIRSWFNPKVLLGMLAAVQWII